MPTKLSRYAEGIMEAAWLAAMVMTPLFFNKYSSRIFEPDKATLLRTLALIILGAWLIKVVEEGIPKPKTSWADSLKTLTKTPIVGLVIALAIVYITATVLSVTPRISFWGSYQRLQGTYTTLSYLVLFAALAGNLRKRGQVDRLITTAILTSLPVSLYGVLQKYGIDPIPWGGDVTRRVASHMGNAIFVAAYLIMVIPLTVGRIIESFNAILKEEHGLGQHVARSTIYIFIAALQLIAVFFSRSRGPLLGLMAGSFFLFLLLSLHWRKRWVTFTIIGLAAAAGVFLLVLNIPDSPIEDLKDHPAVGRLGHLLDTEANSAKVRIYIWEGAANMVAPHDPLEYPDGHTDPFNFIRPLIGYGPETMHMAYNPFYPPELAHVEKRNASPDRSHNETWDSLVITGGLGLAVYLGLFASVFYYGLKWLGLINSTRQKIAFFAFYLGGGVISAVGFYLWMGVAFVGIALPFGAILGLIGYLTLSALFTKQSSDTTQFRSARSITLIVLLAAVVSHFAEINFGIAIVATRTYFWAYAALLLAVGYFLPQRGEYLTGETIPTALTSTKSKRQRGKKYQAAKSQKGFWNRDIAIGSFITSLLLLPLLFEYISNINGGTSALQILWTSLTRVNQASISYGVLALVLTTWLAASILFASEHHSSPNSNSLKNFGIILGISGGIGLLYAFWLSGSLASIVRNVPETVDELKAQAGSFENLLTQFYLFMLLIMFILAGYLPHQWPKRATSPSSFGIILAPIMLILVIGLSYFTNWRVIQADIAFKLAEPFASSNQWGVANMLYQRAKDHAPDEDYYDLFLGRGYLEQAKTITDEAEKQAIFEKAEADLLKAQETNPLNPDHTANLARLYSWWASQTQDQAERRDRSLVSDDYYSRVLVLSPNNARLWSEWGVLHLDILRQPERAFELLNRALEIDSEYDWTHALLANYYLRIAQQTETPAAKEKAFQKSIEHYRQAIELTKSMNYFYALASVYQTMNDLDGVIIVLEEALVFAKSPHDIWKIEENLARISFQLGRKAYSLQHALNALDAAPDSEKERLNQLIQQIEAAP